MALLDRRARTAAKVRHRFMFMFMRINSCLYTDAATIRICMCSAGPQCEQRRAPEGLSHQARSPASGEVAAEDERGVGGGMHGGVALPDGSASKQQPLSIKPRRRRRQSKVTRRADDKVRSTFDCPAPATMCPRLWACLHPPDVTTSNIVTNSPHRHLMLL